MKRIPLSQGKYALVDDADYERVSQYNWCLNMGYAVRHVYHPSTSPSRRYDVEAIFMHRFILDPPDDMEVDHINGDRSDNRRSNLREATRSQNSVNSGPRAGTSEYKGVSLFKRDGTWHASLVLNRKKHHLGTFTNEAEAAKAYDDAAYTHFGEFAYLNFPERFE